MHKLGSNGVVIAKSESLFTCAEGKTLFFGRGQIGQFLFGAQCILPVAGKN